MRDRWMTLATLATLVAVAVVSAWERLALLMKSLHPFGVDGYYYAVQLRALDETGALQLPALPLAFWLAWPFAAVAGPIAGAKYAAAFLGVLVVVPAYALGARFGGSRVTGVLGAVIATMSAGSFFLSVELFKTSVGVSVALAFIALMLAALDRPSAPRIAFAVLAFIAAALTHKLAVGLCVIAALPAFAAHARHRGVPLATVLLVAATLALAATAALLVFAPVTAAFSAQPSWSFAVLEIGDRAVRLSFEPLIAAVAAVAAIAFVAFVRRSEMRSTDVAVLLALAAFALVGACPWLDVSEPEGLGLRVRALAFVPLAVIVPALVGVAQRSLTTWQPRARTYAMVALTIGWAAQPRTRDEGLVATPPLLAEAMTKLAGVLPPNASVTSPTRRVVFMAMWFARVDARLAPDDTAPLAQRVRLLTRAFLRQVGEQAMADALAKTKRAPLPWLNLHPRDPLGLVVIPEETWRTLLASLPADVRAAADGARTRATRSPASAAEDARALAAQHRVPEPLLLAMAHSESRNTLDGPEEPPFGVVRLVRWRPSRSPQRAAELLGVDVNNIDADRALEGAAALLADAARAESVSLAGPLDGWRPALARFHGGADPIANELYADDVLLIATGGQIAAGIVRSEVMRGADFADSWPAAATTWRVPAKPRAVRAIVIHTMESTLPIIFEHFRRNGTEVGAHYLVRARDGHTIQMIDERDVAFHDACFNDESIGIEIEGFVGAGERWFDDATYRATARLVVDIARRQGVPLTRDAILGHGETDDCSDHTDPGPLWDWDRLFAEIAAAP